MKINPEHAERLAKHVTDLVTDKVEAPNDQVAYFVTKMKSLHQERVQLGQTLKSLEQQVGKARGRLMVIESQLGGYTEDIYALDPEFQPPQDKALPEPEEIPPGDITHIE